VVPASAPAVDDSVATTNGVWYFQALCDSDAHLEVEVDPAIVPTFQPLAAYTSVGNFAVATA
jgi:hypothetical protein